MGLMSIKFGENLGRYKRVECGERSYVYHHWNHGLASVLAGLASICLRQSVRSVFQVLHVRVEPFGCTILVWARSTKVLQAHELSLGRYYFAVVG